MIESSYKKKTIQNYIPWLLYDKNRNTISHLISVYTGYLGITPTNSLHIFDHQHYNVAEFAGCESKRSRVFSQKHG